jgi:methylmalonyl-CoA mutase N-terminal domain/subunit
MIDSGRRKVVGVNAFEEPDEAMRIEILRIPLELERKQISRLNKVRRERDAAATQEALARLEGVIGEGGNTIASTVDAVRALATTGEIGALYRRMYGQYNDPGL